MTNSTRFEMHQDHNSWKKEDETWQDDLRVWEEEAQKALNEFAQVQTTLAEHLQTLQNHAAAVRLYEVRCDEHEKAIAAHERGCVVPYLNAVNNGHEREACKHEDLQQFHESLKRTHHIRMAHWNALIKALQV